MALTRSTTVWHDDGDVVLACGSTAFKVRLATLAATCAVFNDMADLPQPHPASAPSSEAPETFDGSPVITLHDAPADAEAFLQAVYDTAYCSASALANSRERPPSPAFPALAAVLRLATKYEAPRLRRAVLDALAAACARPHAPSDCTQTPAQTCQAQTQQPAPAKFDLGAALALCLETDVYSLLPTLLYDACVTRSVENAFASILAAGLPPSTTSGVLARLTTGRERLRAAEVRHYLAFLSPSSMRPGCQNRNSDTARLQLFANRVLFEVAAEEPYQRWCARNPNAVGKSIGLCDVCCAAVAADVVEAGRRVWEELPEVFGFDSWDVLRAKDEL